MTISAEGQGPRRSPAKGARRSRGPADQPPDSAADYPVGQQPSIEPAFRAYVESRRRLASAFQGRARYDKEAYDGAERNYAAYEKAIDRAMKEREKAERDALIAYAETLARAEEQAAEIYHQRMRLALGDCRRATEQAWKSSVETSEATTGVFAKDDSIPQREAFAGRFVIPRKTAASVSASLRRWSGIALTRARVAAHGITEAVRMGRNSLSPRVHALGTAARSRVSAWKGGIFSSARRGAKASGQTLHPDGSTTQE